MYVFAEFFGAAIAAALVLPLYGFGQFGSLFDTRIFRWLGLSVPHHFTQQQVLRAMSPTRSQSEDLMHNTPLELQEIPPFMRDNHQFAMQQLKILGLWLLLHCKQRYS